MDLFWLRTEKSIVATVLVEHILESETIKLAVCLGEDIVESSGMLNSLIINSPVLTRFVHEGEAFYYQEAAVREFNFANLKLFDADMPSYQTWLIARPILLSNLSYNPFILRDPINLHRITYSSKLPTYATPYQDIIPVGFFNIPLSTSSYSDCYLMVAAKRLILTGDPLNVIEYDRTVMTDNDVRDLRVSRFPKIILTASGDLTPTNIITITAQVLDYNGNLLPDSLELFFENINGQISHTRKVTTNGLASIKVSAPMLEPGDSVRLKAGVKFYSGISDITLEVKAE